MSGEEENNIPPSSLYVERTNTEPDDPEEIFMIKSNKKGKMRAPNDLQRIFHRVNQANSLYYLTKAKSVKPNETRDVLQESTPFKFPQDVEQFAFKVVQKTLKDNLHRKKLDTKYWACTNVKSRQTLDLLKRLYIEDPKDVKEAKTLLDIDPEFYTIVEGRPTTKRFNMNNYLQNIRNVLRTRIETGYRQDEIIVLERKLKREEQSIARIRRNIDTYTNSFETFLKEDYDESVQLLTEADQATMQTMKKAEQIRKLYTEQAAVQFAVHKLEEHWRDLKMYQKFLYFISPISWRQKYDYIHRKELEMDTDIETSSVFRKYRLTSQGHIPSLSNLVDEYLECVTVEEEPLLYFTSTDELMQVFRFIEIQNLNCLLHTEEIAIPMENMRMTMEEAKRKFEEESKAMQNVINRLEEQIEWERQCGEELKAKAMKHIDGIFRTLISDDEILRLHVYVEDVYESCIMTNDSDLNIHDMMVEIEECFNSLILQLDNLPQHLVKRAEKYRFAEQERLNKLCNETAQKIAMVDTITWRLKKSLEPPYQRTERELKWRSAPPTKTEPPPLPPRNLTTREKEYLTFFTTYCPYVDQVEDYGIDLSVSETDLKQYSVMTFPENK